MAHDELYDMKHKIIRDFSNIDYEELDHVPIGSYWKAFITITSFI